jgi:large subunit ribosomal protein L17
MKKRIAFRKLGRTTSHRLAMLGNMVTSLIEHERIVTTTPKAKEVRRLADKLVTYAKKEKEKRADGSEGPSLHGRRLASRIVTTSDAQSKLMNVLGPRYMLREGGYTRVLKLSLPRLGDKADMSVVEYVDRPGEVRAARPPSALQNIWLEGRGRRQSGAVLGGASSSSSPQAALEEAFRRLGIAKPDEQAFFLPADGGGGDGAAGKHGREEEEEGLDDLPPFPNSPPRRGGRRRGVGANKKGA